MAKSKHSPAEYRQSQEKKLNTARKPGFNFNALFEQGDEFVEQAQDVCTDQLLDYLDNTGYKYVGELQPLHDCICIVCKTIPFKLLNFATMWAFEPYFNNYIFYFSYEEKILKYLEEKLESNKIWVCANYAPYFNRFKMLKLCPKWANYRLSSLPQLTENQVDKILELDKKIKENENLYFPINKPNGTYRMPVAIAGILAKNVLNINTLITLEQLLQQMSISSAILDNKNLEQAYIIEFKTFLKQLNFKGKKDKKRNIIKKSFDELMQIGLIDKYAIDNNNLYLQSSTITKHIRQQIKRNTGYYSHIPATRQAPYIATFVNYLYWISNSPGKYEQLTISLETLLIKHLGLGRLLQEHRIGEIAKILILLRQVGVEYGLLAMPADAIEITSTDIKYLLENKTQLHEYIVLTPQSGKEEK